MPDSSPGAAELEATVTPTDTAVPGADAGASPPKDGNGVTSEVAAAPGADAGKDGQEGAPPKDAGSGVTEVPKPKTALEAVERSLAKEAAKKEASPTSAKPTEGEADPKAKATDAAQPDDQLPFAKHPRWQEVLKERDTYRVAAEKNQTVIEDLTPKAKHFEELSTWLNSNNLQQDDFASALSIAQAVRNDPAKAYEMLRPVMEQLETLVGERLPADLQKAIADGHMTEEAARLTAKARGEATIANSRLETFEQQRAREAEQRRTQDSQNTENVVVTALNTWESEWAKRDPDAAKVKPFLNELLLFKASQKPPMNAIEARQLAEDCVIEVKNRLRGLVPAPKPKAGGLPQGGHSPSNAVPVPKSALEAAELALSAARHGG
jgi:hypothetical protein